MLSSSKGSARLNPFSVRGRKRWLWSVKEERKLSTCVSDKYVPVDFNDASETKIIASGVFPGFGLTINGKHTFCGDFIFSGHTMMFVLSYLVVSECKCLGQFLGRISFLVLF